MGNMEMVKYLVDHGADLNKKNTYGKTPLFNACYHCKSVEAIKYLIEKGANVNEEDKSRSTPMFDVLYSTDKKDEENSIEIIRHLKEYGVILDIENNNGQTILHHIVVHITLYHHV